MTASYYSSDPTFRGLLADWEANRRCPPELADWVQDRDGESPLWRASVTAAGTPLRPAWNESVKCGLYPSISVLEVGKYWWMLNNLDGAYYAGDLPPEAKAVLFNTYGSSPYFSTVFDALVAVLDAFAEVYAAEPAGVAP